MSLNLSFEISNIEELNKLTAQLKLTVKKIEEFKPILVPVKSLASNHQE